MQITCPIMFVKVRGVKAGELEEVEDSEDWTLEEESESTTDIVVTE